MGNKNPNYDREVTPNGTWCPARVRVLSKDEEHVCQSLRELNGSQHGYFGCDGDVCGMVLHRLRTPEEVEMFTEGFKAREVIAQVKSQREM